MSLNIVNSVVILTASFSIILSIEETVFNYLATHVPHILVVLLLMYATYKMTSLVLHWKERVKKTESDCDSFRNTYIPDLHNKFGGVDKKLGTLIISVNKISTHIMTLAGL